MMELTKGEAIIVMAVLFELSKPFDPPKAADSSSARGGIGK